MTPLIIEVDGRVLRLEGDRTIRIGRAIEADIVLTAGSASRQHAAIRPVDGVWTLADAGSNYGTFVNGQRITVHPITDRVEVTCGPDAPGARLVIYPEPVAPDALSAPSQAPAPVPPAVHEPLPAGPSFPPPVGSPAGPPAPGRPAAQPAAAGPSGPAGAGHDPGDPFGQTQVVSVGSVGGPAGMMAPASGPDLLVVAEGKEHRFRHPTQVTIGRHPDSTVVLTDPAASRAHGQITPIADGWTYTNISNEGTYVDGRRVSQTKVDDRMQLRLGHPTAGPELTVVPILSAAEEEKRIARRKRKRLLATIGAAAAVLVLIAGVIVGATWFFNRDDGEPVAKGDGDRSAEPVDTMKELTGEELDTAEAATVMLYFESTLVEDSSAEVGGSGSGSIISEDGLILTNAHVATPADPDIVEYYGTPPEEVVNDPEYLTVFITDPKTGETAATYRAEVVASDGELDAAVLQIVSDDDGEAVDPDELDLPAIERGDSEKVDTGDPVTILGFPAIASSDPYQPGKSVTVTGGKIATVLRDVDEFDTDARVSPGNSGGLAIDNDARLIGIPTKGRGDAQGNVSARIRMINAVDDLITEAEEAS